MSVQHPLKDGLWASVTDGAWVQEEWGGGGGGGEGGGGGGGRGHPMMASGGDQVRIFQWYFS